MHAHQARALARVANSSRTLASLRDHFTAQIAAAAASGKRKLADPASSYTGAFSREDEDALILELKEDGYEIEYTQRDPRLAGNRGVSVIVICW